jgi:predicted helicase
MTSLYALLSQYRSLSQSEREKGTYFERLIQCYLTHEASYKDLYEHVWMCADWAREQGLNAQDAGTAAVILRQAQDERRAKLPFVVSLSNHEAPKISTVSRRCATARPA